MKKIEVWTFKFCPFCVKAKRLLDQLDIEYVEHMISFGDKRLNELEAKTGCGTLPQIFADEAYIGDCSELYDLHDKGLLLDMLRG